MTAISIICTVFIMILCVLSDSLNDVCNLNVIYLLLIPHFKLLIAASTSVFLI